MNIDEFNLRCGILLRSALSVESDLDMYIEKYFCEMSYREFVLRDLILNNTTFNRKVQIFKGICKQEEVDKELVRKTVRAIGFIQDTRNQVAHWEAEADRDGKWVQLQKKNSVKYSKDAVRLSDELMEKFEKCRMEIVENLPLIDKRWREEKVKMAW